jgi:hypothetical protein
MPLPIAATDPGTRHRTLLPFITTFGGAALLDLSHHAFHLDSNDATLAPEGLDRVPFRTSTPSRTA